ncbi:uncharacterized protein LOC126904077 [Daktulosphaira vitifoliae]|uniref:uncharacterized protein LOC126904077 n=1 Tax=Daktulosphaira vitifoliae TaxID=58002 RepID=UPI0021AA57FD|nr:uncharacterized protein LOC126904077 [Daktulosphaira vitifoliae]
MISLKLAKIGFILFSVIFCTKSNSISRKNMDQLDNLLRCCGWKNLNELIFIKYYNKEHYLQNLMKIPTDRNSCRQKIRALTIYLGCIYANVVNNILPIISNIVIICQNKFTEENDLINGFICTEELINIISFFIVPLATLMEGAMDTLNSLHSNPLSLEKYNYMIRPLFTRIRNILEYLNKQTLSRDDISTYIKKLNIVDKYFNITILQVNKECKIYCEFVSHCKDYLWNDWNLEYTAISQDIELVFFKFLKSKIEDYIKTIIIEKYFNLGFIFDPITEETFLPLANESLELELEFKAIGEKPPTAIKIEYH